MGKEYIIIDLKSFYASVECVERGLDPLTTRLVVADAARGRGTICLAVTPALKQLGIRNRCRLHEVPPGLQTLVAEPRMQLYVDYSVKIYGIYLRYFAPEDIEVYSIDEAFMDVTPYLWLYGCTARELALRVMADILCITGITATCGIGTNLYLAKLALDMLAKHSPDNIGWLDEAEYRRRLWRHRPLTDFWRIGPGTASRLEQVGLLTMEAVARADNALLYRLFGVDAEILIDHAWGREPTTLADIKAYQPHTRSLTNGQVLPRSYSFAEGRVVLSEMADQLGLELVAKELVTGSVLLYVGYGYADGLPAGSFRTTARLPEATSSGLLLARHLTAAYDAAFDRRQTVRRIVLNANQVSPAARREISLFDDEVLEDPREHSRQCAINSLKQRFGKNAIFRALDLLEEATQRQRNQQLGGHRRGEGLDQSSLKKI